MRVLWVTVFHMKHRCKIEISQFKMYKPHTVGRYRIPNYSRCWLIELESFRPAWAVLRP